MHQALAEDAPILHDDRFPDGFPEAPTNLATHISLTVGDPDTAFETAEVVMEQTYRCPCAIRATLSPMPAWRGLMPRGVSICGAARKGISRCALHFSRYRR
ncbi:MAG: hypothetical protein CM15mP74_06450 [Halieaceae bacterium]|nr:MAG: hypothetical protein CM15mP74_06450 [Halieaceae bacterium]